MEGACSQVRTHPHHCMYSMYTYGRDVCISNGFQPTCTRALFPVFNLTSDACVCTHVCVCRVYTLVCLPVCACTCVFAVCAHTCAFACVCMHVCVCLCVHTCVFACVCTHVCVCRVCTHMCVCLCGCAGAVCAWQSYCSIRSSPVTYSSN